MIFYSGLDSVIDHIRSKSSAGRSFEFVPVADPEAIPVSEADVFVIGPDEINPVALVQKIASQDRHLSILILAAQTRYNQISQSLQFSPFVGKNATCLAFSPDADYASVFELAKQRTNQKRSFSRFNFPAANSALTRLSSPFVKIDHFGQALEHAPIGVLLLDGAGKIAGANIRARTMFYQLDGSQMGLERLFSERTVMQIQALIAEGKEEAIEAEEVNGNFYEITVSGSKEARDFRTLLLINDITERKAKDKKLLAILESLPQIAWTAGPEGHINYYTQGWFSYTNQTPEQARREGWTLVVHPDDRKLTFSRWTASVRNQKVFQHAARFRRFDGEYRWHLNRAVPVYATQKTLVMWVGTSTDIHDQVLLAENLEKKVKERTRSLQAANEELEQFAYVSSHDLQEPLRKIQTFAHLVKENGYESLDEISRKYIDKIIGTAIRMSKLLKDLLNFSRLHHQDAVVSVDLNEIINGICDDLELAISQNEAIIKVQNLPVIEGHASQLKQLFYNLIYNSLKFRKVETPPVVMISACIKRSSAENMPFPGGAEYWEIIVKDNGIGFEQKYAEQIFTIFQRLHGRSAYEGTGIGLAICRKVVSNHGGRIFVNSAPGEGAEFHILLPAKMDALPQM